MKTALFVGRFQPLHKGHVYAIRNALKKYNLVILIGSTNKNDKSNPFSFALRKGMAGSVLEKYRKTRRIRITGIKDFESDAEWAQAVKRKAKFDLVISGSMWVRRCFPDFEVAKPMVLDRKKYSATRIRKLMKSGGKWRHLVPREVVEIILNSSGFSRRTRGRA